MGGAPSAAAPRRGRPARQRLGRPIRRHPRQRRLPQAPGRGLDHARPRHRARVGRRARRMTETRDISLIVNGQPRRATVEHAHHAGRSPSRRVSIDGHSRRLRARRLRGLHRAGGWRGRPGLPPCWPSRHTALASRRSRAWRADPRHLNPLQAEFVRHHGAPVRLLHRRHPHVAHRRAPRQPRGPPRPRSATPWPDICAAAPATRAWSTPSCPWSDRAKNLSEKRS